MSAHQGAPPPRAWTGPKLDQATTCSGEGGGQDTHKGICQDGAVSMAQKQMEIGKVHALQGNKLGRA